MPAITVSLSYMVPTAQKPIYIASQGGPDSPPQEGIKFLALVFFDKAS